MGKYPRKLWEISLKNHSNDVCLSVILSCLLLLIPFSCVQNVELDFKRGNEKILVVETEFTNLNLGNYVRLTWLHEVEDQKVLSVDNALIIVSSDDGERDTLTKQEFNEDNPFEGYYFSEKLTCKPNRTYTLKIDVEGRIYEATHTMPPLPPKIDSVRLDFVKYEVGKSDGVLSYMYFKEPVQDKNYYMTKVCPDGNYGRRNPCSAIERYNRWGLLLLDDKHLPPYVNGVNINLPDKPKSDYIPAISGNYLAVLYALSQESFAYYQSLMDALKSDGGVYSPSPANHPTNIKSKHKVVGFFHVVSVDSYPFFAPRR